jgi:hypothetical protein
MKMNGLHAITNGEDWNNTRYSSHFGNLLGKVVILFCENSEAVRTLIVSCAQRGADVALVSSNKSQVSLNPLRRQVQDMGRCLYFVDEQGSKTAEGDQSVSTVLAEFGRVDFLIDLSAKAYDA